jgi:hypothetical protein
MRQKARHRRLAGARWTPKHERAERAGLEHAGERTVGAKKMILADDIDQCVRPKLVRKRPRRGAIETGGGKKARRL